MNSLKNFPLAQNTQMDSLIHSFSEPIMESLRRGVAEFSRTTLNDHNSRKQVGTFDSIVILRLPLVIERINLSKATIYALGETNDNSDHPTWPTYIRLNLRSVGWLSSEVYALLVSRIVSGCDIAASNFIQFELQGASE